MYFHNERLRQSRSAPPIRDIVAGTSHRVKFHVGVQLPPGAVEGSPIFLEDAEFMQYIRLLLRSILISWAMGGELR